MDISDISKIANKKRMDTEVDRLCEKVSRETAKIVKLKVNQDNAFWNVNEKLKQVEGNHEKLQQNMVELQMQNEAISSQYQEELRKRAETLNKVNATRAMCGVLEEYCERLRASLARTQADQVALGEAYALAGEQVTRMREEVVLAHQRANVTISSLQTRLDKSEQREAFAAAEARAANERAQEAGMRAQRSEIEREYLTNERDSLIADRERLNADRDRLSAELGRLVSEYDRLVTALQEKSKVITDLQEELVHIQRENGEKLGNMQSNIENLEKECNDWRRMMEEERATRSGLESQLETASRLEREMRNHIQELETSMNTLKIDQSILVNKYESSEKTVSERDQLLELQGNELNILREECERKSASIESLSAMNAEMVQKVSDLEKAIEAERISEERKMREAEALLAEKNVELEGKATDVTRLMENLKQEENARSKVSNQLRALRDFNASLEAILREKDASIHQLAEDKDRLEKQIREMQNKIDNIQKELKRGDLCELPEKDGRMRAMDVQVDASDRPENTRHYDLHFESDDGCSFDAQEVQSRLRAMASGKRMTSPLLPIQKRGPLFFKNKRAEARAKKSKQ